MTQLVRFHDWIIDEEQILYAHIEAPEGEATSEFEIKIHNVIVKMKDGPCFTLRCRDKYDARKELDLLTSKTDARLAGNGRDNYLINQIYICRNSITNLSEDIKKLMNSFKNSKKKLEKKKQ